MKEWLTRRRQRLKLIFFTACFKGESFILIRQADTKKQAKYRIEHKPAASAKYALIYLHNIQTVNPGLVWLIYRDWEIFKFLPPFNTHLCVIRNITHQQLDLNILPMLKISWTTLMKLIGNQQMPKMTTIDISIMWSFLFFSANAALLDSDLQYHASKTRH